jgi:hypothetical protein
MRILMITILAAALAGCFGLDVKVERQEPVAAARTFFVIRGLDEAMAGRSSRLASDYIYGRLDADIARELAERGYERVLESGRADLVVRYSVFASEWITTRSVPPPPLSRPPPGWDRLMDGSYNGSYSELEVEDHRAGTMVVDVVAVDGGKLVHRFFIEGALTGSPKDNLEKAGEALAEGFEDFPELREEDED